MNQHNLAKTRKSQEDYKKTETSLIGKLPPQAIDVEEAVLGGLLLESGRFEIGYIIPTEDIFYNENHKTIARAILNMYRTGMKVDMLTVAEEVNKLGKLEDIGGTYTIAKLTNSVVSAAHLDSHIKILKQKYILREIINMAGNVLAEAYSNDANPDSIIEKVNVSIDKISQKNIKSDTTPLHEGLSQTLEAMEEERKIKDELAGLTSGLEKVDTVFGGWRAPDLIILAARPAVGKTAFALNYAYHGSAHTPVVVFSYEMSIDQLIRRLISIDTKVPYKEVRTPNLMSEQNWKKVLVCPGLDNRKIFLNDDRSVNTSQMLAICRRLQKEHGLGLIIVDYLQLMPEERNAGNREQQISKISRELKGIAKDLNVPLIALSQLSRDIEKGGKREPMLSDLRESGAIEQDADIVKFLYGPTEDEISKDVLLKDAIFCKVAKFRGGTLQKIVLYKDLSIQTIYDEMPAYIDEISNSVPPFMNNDYLNNYDNDNNEELPF